MTSPILHKHVADFASERVNLPRVVAQEHRDQVNRLRDRLATKISEAPEYGLVKSLHAGSVAKGTALRAINDLDLAVYVRGSDVPTQDRELVSWLAERLYEATTNMDRDQFDEQAHCVTVRYRGSGLDVDVVPVLFEGEQDDVGYLINKNNGARMKTSIRLHLEFIGKRRQDFGQEFLELIRITKWWKRQVLRTQPDFRFKSFMIELIWAHLVDVGIETSDYPSALESFFEWIITTQFDKSIVFEDYHPISDFPARGDSPIEVFDPVNPDNNVAVRYTAADRNNIVDAAQVAYDALTDARFATTKGRAIDDWQVILGPTFKG